MLVEPFNYLVGNSFQRTFWIAHECQDEFEENVYIVSLRGSGHFIGEGFIWSR